MVTVATPSGRLVEYEAERDSGFRLLSGERWDGWRVRYRFDGERRFRSFLLELDSAGEPARDVILRAVDLHATGVAGAILHATGVAGAMR